MWLPPGTQKFAWTLGTLPYKRTEDEDGKYLTIASSKPWSIPLQITLIIIPHIRPVPFQRLAQMRLGLLLRGLDGKLLSFPATSLAFNDRYATGKSVQESGHGIVELAHCNAMELEGGGGR